MSRAILRGAWSSLCNPVLHLLALGAALSLCALPQTRSTCIFALALLLDSLGLL